MIDALFSPWGDIWLRGGWRVQQHCATGQARALNPGGVCVARGSREECIALAVRQAPRAGARRAAVLLHGLWNGPRIMDGLAKMLREQGWAVANIGYPSRLSPVSAHAAAASLVASAMAEDGAREIAFVGHSLGGLVARAAMANAGRDGWQPGPLALIGSPASGSGIARQFLDFPGFRTLVGACSDAVTPLGAATIPPPVSREVCVIAGGNGGAGFNPLIQGDNDGLIAVSETRLREYETRFLRIRALHKSLPMRAETISACAQFLGAGTMSRAGGANNICV